MLDATTLLAVDRGSVIAPAGCGKTELIARAVASMSDGRALVLTHTHAGIRALRKRLLRLRVPRERVHVETIAGWGLRYAAAYPKTSDLKTPTPIKEEWEEIYKATSMLLTSAAIRKVVRASYARVFIDEYQDCTQAQHVVATRLAETLPCVVLGDPLQGIFAFAGGTLRWRDDVENVYPALGELNEPWRWREKNKGLGDWLLAVRAKLIAGEPLDLRSGPITWLAQGDRESFNAAYRLLRETGDVVVIRKYPKQAHKFARDLGGSYRSMEEVECNDLLAFAGTLDEKQGIARANHVIAFAEQCMTGTAQAFGAIRESLQKGKFPQAARVAPERRPLLSALQRMAESTDPVAVKAALQAIDHAQGIALFRKELWTEAKKAVDAHIGGGHALLREAAWASRNRSRFVDRSLDRHLISRTLLIKGLEFDHVLVPDADEFAGASKVSDHAKHMYVALTRASISLTVISKDPVLRFAQPVL